MDQLVIPRKRTRGCRFHRRSGIRLLVALICCGLTATAQNSTQQDSSKASNIRATHLVGLENAKNGCSGTLSIQDGFLQFQQIGKSGIHIKIGSVRDAVLGEESRQVGGLPLTIGEAAVPYGGGRVVSLFAHRKYDTLTLEYVDADEGIHGAIFQLIKGHGALVKNKLIAQGATINSRQDQSKKENSAEATHENK